MRKDCTFNKSDRCVALDTKNCFYNCAFYKTKEDYEKSKNKSDERLKTLEIKHQKYIAEKYYNRKQLFAKGKEK